MHWVLYCVYLCSPEFELYLFGLALQTGLTVKPVYGVPVNKIIFKIAKHILLPERMTVNGLNDLITLDLLQVPKQYVIFVLWKCVLLVSFNNPTLHPLPFSSPLLPSFKRPCRRCCLTAVLWASCRRPVTSADRAWLRRHAEGKTYTFTYRFNQIFNQNFDNHVNTAPALSPCLITVWRVWTGSLIGCCLSRFWTNLKP